MFYIVRPNSIQCRGYHDVISGTSCGSLGLLLGAKLRASLELEKILGLNTIFFSFDTNDVVAVI